MSREKLKQLAAGELAATSGARDSISSFGVAGVSSTGQLRERIRATGLRVTAPRLSVLAYLETVGGPVSHPEVTDGLSSEGWDRATLYRNLVDLTEVGLVRRTDHGDHVWRFELVEPDSVGKPKQDHLTHPHFVCGSCGDVMCLPIETIELHLGRTMPGGLSRASIREIQLRGTCTRCV